MSPDVIIFGIIVGIALSFCVTSWRLAISNDLDDGAGGMSEYSKGPLIVHEYRKNVEERDPALSENDEEES